MSAAAVAAEEVAAKFAGRFPDIAALITATGGAWRVALRGAAGLPCIVVAPRHGNGFGLKFNELFTVISGLDRRKYRIDALFSQEQNDSFISELTRRLTLANWSRDDVFEKRKVK
ncbi:MAG: hypothetical protein WA733_10370 [Methylocystis sp.]